MLQLTGVIEDDEGLTDTVRYEWDLFDNFLTTQGVRDKVYYNEKMAYQLADHIHRRRKEKEGRRSITIPIPNKQQLGCFIMTLLICFVYHHPLTPDQRQAGYRKPPIGRYHLTALPERSPFYQMKDPLS